MIPASLFLSCYIRTADIYLQVRGDWEKHRELHQEILLVAACKLRYIHCSARDDINVLFKKLLSGQCTCIFHNVYVLVCDI